MAHSNMIDSTELLKSIEVATEPQDVINIVIKTIVEQPDRVEDDFRKKVSEYFHEKNVEAEGLVTQAILAKLGSSKSQSQLLTWLKYETILTHLIKEHIYKPNKMASEVLATVKCDLNSKIAAKFSSVLNGCVKYCREANKETSANTTANTDGDEEEENWCEIIDWMSWFLGNDDEDMGDL